MFESNVARQRTHWPDEVFWASAGHSMLCRARIIQGDSLTLQSGVLLTFSLGRSSSSSRVVVIEVLLALVLGAVLVLVLVLLVLVLVLVVPVPVPVLVLLLLLLPLFF